ncbi:MAG: hypothetical protein R3192_07950 [Woeseiaceae bacterium]|nr:hypothetical protein [Woeseiaceae bacterium]
MNEETYSKFDDELMAAAGKLATEVSPDRDLWPEIEQSIVSPARRRGAIVNSIWAQAAAVLLLIGGSSGLTYMLMNKQADDVSPVSQGQALIFEPVSANFGSRYSLGPDYQDARRSLIGKMDDELSRLTPEERATVENNIQIIRQAIDDINQALASEPDNALLQRLLLNAYHEELDLMRRVDSITSAAMRRGDI